MCKPWKTYLLWFAQEHVEFRFAEIESLIALLRIDMKFVQKPKDIEPYWLVQFPSESQVKLLASRSVSLRNCIELWGHANNFNDLHEKLKKLPENVYHQYFQADKSFKIEVETFCKHFTQKEKVEKLEKFSYLPVQGPVNLNNPDVTFQYIEYYGTVPHSPPELPYDVFFGRWVANGLRQLISKLTLKTRKFIGNTSMDPQLSLLMANQAKVKNGDIVLDPFVGSGSLLVAAAEFGAYVWGSDIDYLMLHARTRPSRISQKKREKDESIKANMKQYNLLHKYLDVLVKDFAAPFWRDSLQFNAIITDPFFGKTNAVQCVSLPHFSEIRGNKGQRYTDIAPGLPIKNAIRSAAPYGIREATERVGTSKEKYTVKEEHLLTHVPAKIEYGISNIYKDLLQFSAKHLVTGGRLVCWFPIFREDYEDKGLPSHPCLKLVANSEQVLTKVTSRRLLTFEKMKEPTEEEINIKDNEITDFREKYFVVREETRKERRMREADARKKNWIKYQDDNKIT